MFDFKMPDQKRDAFASRCRECALILKNYLHDITDSEPVSPIKRRLLERTDAYICTLLHASTRFDSHSDHFQEVNNAVSIIHSVYSDLIEGDLNDAELDKANEQLEDVLCYYTYYLDISDSCQNVFIRRAAYTKRALRHIKYLYTDDSKIPDTLMKRLLDRIDDYIPVLDACHWRFPVMYFFEKKMFTAYGAMSDVHNAFCRLSEGDNVSELEIRQAFASMAKLIEYGKKVDWSDKDSLWSGS